MTGLKWRTHWTIVPAPLLATDEYAYIETCVTPAAGIIAAILQ